MANNNGQLDTIIEQTIQGQVKPGAPLYDGGGMLDILPLLVKTNDILPPYWSRQRDIAMSKMCLQSDHVSGALSYFNTKVSGIKFKIEPRDYSIKSWVKLADTYQEIMMHLSDYGQGWHTSLCPKFAWDFITQDNGAFIEVIGDGNPENGNWTPLALAHLDAQCCRRTSDPIYPVIYTDPTNGNFYRLHYKQVIFASDQPSPRVKKHGVGFCAFSRMANTAQHLIDISTAEQEQLGSRPKRKMIIAKSGITGEELLNAFRAADIDMDNTGLKRYSRSVVIGPKDRRAAATPIDIDVKDLTEAIIGNDKEKSVTLGMFCIALALNIPPRWIWPATQSGATKADAMFSHIAGMGGGIGQMLLIFEKLFTGTALTTKFLPPQLKITFDVQDDEQDRQQAENRDLRSQTTERNVNDGVVTIRVAREQAMEAGDITDAQFADMELAEGRLSDGSDILTLFMSGDKDMQDLLSLSVGDVLNVPANDKEFVLAQIDEKMLDVQATIANPDRPALFDKATQALAALKALKKLYEDNGQSAEEETAMEPKVDVTESEQQGETDNNVNDGGIIPVNIL